jgi:hypothetical protein
MNVDGRRTRWQDPLRVPTAPVGLVEIADEDPRAASGETLHYRLSSRGPEALEALRDARRAMIREESSRGLEDGEPPLSEAVFSAFEVLWDPPFRPRCREKLATLVRRANLLIESARAAAPRLLRRDGSKIRAIPLSAEDLVPH